ncbi:MAG: hypothetical protein EP308_11495 [Burkholderiales bacterium]|nr:MAG: hypothetical protein EP308_11495 [Burkholderiales bacterium]
MGAWRPALLLMALALFLSWTDSAGFRQGIVRNTQACAVTQMLALPPGVDFVAIGSSRIRQGIDPQHMVKVSGGRLRQPMNFGRGGRSVQRNFAILEDLLERGARPAAILFEVDLDRLASNAKTRSIPVPRDIGILSFRDLFGTYGAHPDRPVIERLQNVALKVLVKLRTALMYTFSGDAIGHQLLALRTEQADTTCRVPNYDVRLPVHVEKTEALVQHYDKVFGPSRRTTEDDRFQPGNGLHAQDERHYLERAREVAARHRVRLIVTQPWNAGQPPLSGPAQDRIRAIIPEFVYPPPELVRASWDHFFDHNHMDTQARLAYSGWLATEVVRGMDP